MVCFSCFGCFACSFCFGFDYAAFCFWFAGFLVVCCDVVDSAVVGLFVFVVFLLLCFACFA